ncbi:hypothetical protein MGG_17883 [Pyricularia oryzae 70-15]|uniref:Uncharacterized protein n=3 Tax=Pyricularia oryzae TaxID=318829 RepID=G5EH67_PYRO7|nr:uncharacterized protein MGG_17883 [Pyricularia oryzae 70-15]EAQ71419.1 hypothetical protein MGCH7_ch7g826 [Pyricularia oryzae 70-15]EHA45906.1 hypothetical protein MGG_17883 [Pyricularia oryzae 70-15]ELQ41493.1 hypothetical protein OOU_Y34scaffold00275g9 [Pyricularia oryzae Y34]
MQGVTPGPGEQHECGIGAAPGKRLFQAWVCDYSVTYSSRHLTRPRHRMHRKESTSSGCRL